LFIDDALAARFTDEVDALRVRITISKSPHGQAVGIGFHQFLCQWLTELTPVSPGLEVTAREPEKW